MRSSIACVRCRRSKVKCVNTGPNTTCRACEASNRECSYPQPVIPGTVRSANAQVSQASASILHHSAAGPVPLGPSADRAEVSFILYFYFPIFIFLFLFSYFYFPIFSLFCFFLFCFFLSFFPIFFPISFLFFFLFFSLSFLLIFLLLLLLSVFRFFFPVSFPTSRFPLPASCFLFPNSQPLTLILKF